MNGMYDFGAYGHGMQTLAQAHTIRIEANHRTSATRHGRRRGLRYRVGKALVVTGSRVMGPSVDARDVVQPVC
jgi:hypothetical protein